MIAALGQLVAQYGYIAVAGGCFFEGEAAVLLGMFAVHEGYLSTHGVWLAAFIGTLIGDNIWLHIGRAMGRPAIARRPPWQARANRIEALVERRGALLIIGFRWIYAMRSLTPFVLGSVGVSPWRFLFFDVIGILIWATVMSLIGFYLAEALQQALRHIEIAELLLLVVAVLAATLGYLIYRRRRR